MAGRRGDRVALAVGLEGGAVAVVLPAVELDDDLRLGEVRVDFQAADDCVDLWRGQAVAGAEVHEVVLPA
jgi:hypothetical protein